MNKYAILINPDNLELFTQFCNNNNIQILNVMDTEHLTEIVVNTTHNASSFCRDVLHLDIMFWISPCVGVYINVDDSHFYSYFYNHTNDEVLTKSRLVLLKELKFKYLIQNQLFVNNGVEITLEQVWNLPTVEFVKLLNTK